MRDVHPPSEMSDESDPLNGRVLRMDRAARLEPDRTIRSTCYSDKLQSLSIEGQKRVEMMEALLFEQGRRTTSCAQGDLHLPDSRFECSEGKIWYHFSASKSVFVLAYFELHSRSGNRSGSGRSGTPEGGRSVAMPCGWGDGIAARLAQLLAAQPSYFEAVAWLNASSTNQDLLLTIGGEELDVNSAPSGGRLLVEIAFSCHLMQRGEIQPKLPPWSLLSRMAMVSEQLQNPYARSIFAGEALCRLGEEIGKKKAQRVPWNRLSTLPAVARNGSHFTDLFSQSTAILEAIRDGAPHQSLRARVSFFVTAPLMDEDMLGDVRRLNLIHSEITWLLSRAIGALRHRVRRTTTQEVLRRYALLSEFTILSASYFGLDEHPPAGFSDEELASLKDSGHGWQKGIMRSLDDFGSSTMMIVDHLMPLRDSRYRDSEEMHARLCWLASEVLSENSNV